jgi:SOS-response transcriptional repressor LexA
MMPASDTLRIGYVNTPCIATLRIGLCMTGPAERLRKAREAAGYTSATKAAQAFGWGESAYRHHENGTRRFDVDTAIRYARAFKINAGDLLALDLVRPAAPKGKPALFEEVRIAGKVAAGVWREPDEWEQRPQEYARFGPSPYPKAGRFALEVEGHSMDKEYPPGTLLDCLSIFDLGMEPEPGDHVIVERIRPDGRREMTVKRYHLDDEGHPWLVPDSTKVEFRPFRADDDAEDGSEVRVIAFVIGSYQRNLKSRFYR